MTEAAQFDCRTGRMAGRLDGRSTTARRVRDLAATYTAAMGGGEGLTAIDRENILKAAQLTVAAEDMRRRSLKGEEIDLASLIKLENLAARAVRALNLGVKRKAPAASLQDYLRSKAAENAA